MNPPTPYDEMEALLARFQPAEPSAPLLGRLQAAKPGRPKVIAFLPWLALGAAAVLVGMVFSCPHPDSPGHPETVAPRPAPPLVVQTRESLLEVKDLGLLDDASAHPTRLMRTTWMDEILCETSPGVTEVREARIRQEIQPVSLNLY